tara:strand:+ start:86 stop:1462 length:1377 start_codon:yes stop_codon:yes gene_type:complete
MAHHVRQNPLKTNQLGLPNLDTTSLPEFTFHHGHVIKVVNDARDLDGYGVSNIPKDVSQCIVMTPTFEGVLPSGYLKSQIFAQPLLRGFSDSIARGDSVLYIKIGGIFFYLGPLNTTNFPNKTPDHLYQTIENKKRLDYDKTKDASDGYNGEYVTTDIKKANKPRDYILDKPFGVGRGEPNSQIDFESNWSDLQLEGRHGNSIQLGSRFVNPYLTLKNNNNENNVGSILGMFSLGRVDNHIQSFEQLSYDIIIDKAINNEQGDEKYKGFHIGAGNDNDERFNYDYAGLKPKPNEQTEFDQVVLISDRITFDANVSDLTMSSAKHINIGVGENFILNTKGYSVIETKNIYIGKEAKKREQPMVLGEELRKMLEDIVNILSNAHALVQGVPVPLVDNVGAPLSVNKIISGTTRSLEDILKDLQQEEFNPQINEENKPVGDRTTGGTPILSNHHFIEPNRS